MADSWWDDFSNNLATDLAPLVALFGENPTKQYLSECLNVEDIILFSVAPLGVITAVVSAIRVRGTPSLRAFVGRAQEGAGLAEVELCSSTSRDVCELYTNGGIARVFGRPKLLEIVHDPKASSKELFPSSGDQPTAGLYSFQEYLKTERGHNDWTSSSNDQRSSSTTTESGITHGKPPKFAPNPNLSFNIGIKSHGRFWFITAAAFGVCLQSFVLVWAFLARYYYLWLRDSREDDYAVPVTIIGTAFLCLGMALCAHLIESKTEEAIYHRRLASNRHDLSKMFWIQPGNQTIGDQVFDSFSYSDALAPLTRYVTSWQDTLQIDASARLIWLAVLATTVGFVFQFLGIRACHSSVAIAQLGATILMSVIRSGLRTQRLKKEDNFMAYDPELFQGHELDWLALRLDQRHPCSKEPSVNAADFRSRRLWLVYSHPLRRDIRNTAASISCTAHQQQASDVIERLIPIDSKSGNIIGFRIKNQDAYNDNAELVQARVEKEFQEQLAKIYNSECDTTGMPAESWEQPSRIAKAYFYRSRLARMTGVGQPQSDQSSHWGTRFVPVREMANKLADAIEETMNTLFQPQFDPPPVLQESWDQSFAILWAVPCCLEDDFGVAPETGHIYLTIRRRPDQLPSSVWTTDRSEIESVLGLWLWSLENTLERQNAREAGAKKGDETMNRIVHANDTWATSSGDLVNLDIWRERSNCQFRAWRLQKQDLHSPPQVSISMNTTIDLPWEHMRNSFDIRSPRGQNETWWKNGDDYVFHTTGPPADWVDKKRFFGWTNMVSESTDNPVHVLEIESKLSLEANCAQELYSIFLSSIMKITHDIGGHTKAEKYQGGLKASNECIDSIQAAIIQTGLCDKNDAFACTIPILGRLGHLKISDEVLTAALEIAENYLRLGKWDDAGRYFSWILDQSVFRFTSKNEAKMTLKSTEATNNFRLSLLRVCETSRRALLQDNHSARMFGYRQILELLHRFASTENIISLRLVWSDIGTLPNSEVTGHQLTMSDVIQCYGNVALRCLETKRSPSRDEIRLRGNLESIIQLGHCADSIVTAINNSDLSSTLYLLERVHFPEPHRSRGFIMACKKGWYMVVEILIKIGANIHFEDQGRTALSYSSEYGDINIVRLLIRSGAELRSKSNTSYEPERFPCHYAAENGHATIIDAMVQEWKSSSEMDREDDRNMTPLSLAITYGNPSTVRALLSRGSWVDANHYHTKKPALHLAIAIGREDMVEVLLQCSTVDPNHSHGATIDCPPLVLALKKNQESMFDMILAASNVNADCEDNQGRTALWWAASLNRKSYVYKLLDSGKVCLPDKADRSGRTALSVATEAGSTDICSLLREFETMH